MIENLHLKNFKAFRELELPLGQVTCLVGANGAGKSTILDALWLAGVHWYQVCGLPPLIDELRWATGRLALDLIGNRATPIAPPEFAVASTAGEHKFELRVSMNSSTDGRRWLVPGIARAGGDVETQALGRSVASDVLRIHEGETLRHPLARVFKLQFSFERAVSNLGPQTSTTPIASDGAGLGVALMQLVAAREGGMEALEADLNMIVPHVLRILPTMKPNLRAEVRASKSPSFTYGFDLVCAGQGNIPAVAASEGTIFAIVVLALLHLNGAKVLLIDDVERGLHPRAQREMIEILKRVAREKDVQIVFTSHSPFVVGCMSAEDVYVVAHDPQVGSKARKLSEHEDWQRSKGALDAGEFWSGVGEDWALEQK